MVDKFVGYLTMLHQLQKLFSIKMGGWFCTMNGKTVEGYVSGICLYWGEIEIFKFQIFLTEAKKDTDRTENDASNCWRRCFLCGPPRSYINKKTSGFQELRWHPLSVWVTARIAPSRGGVTGSQTPPLVEEEAPFQNKQKSWKEQIYGHEFRRGPTVLVSPAAIYPTDRLSGIRGDTQPHRQQGDLIGLLLFIQGK
jgi:hypothetical protein